MSQGEAGDRGLAKTLVYTWDDVQPEKGEGVSRRLIPGDGASLKMVSIKAGTVAGRHSHPYEQFVHVIEGSGQLECETGTIPLKQGTVIHFAPDAWHSAVFEIDTVLVEVNLRPVLNP
jgi:quercetin dioxygenase-like cupin family protein